LLNTCSRVQKALETRRKRLILVIFENWRSLDESRQAHH
jgi:hypothetical protein